MATYVEYKLEDGSELLVEVDAPTTSVVKVSKKGDNAIIETNTKFQEALKNAKSSTVALLAELNDLPIDEMEVTFGLKSTGEAGFFAIGKLGLEANYQVTLKWKRSTP